jgi:hypothetical protein
MSTVYVRFCEDLGVLLVRPKGLVRYAGHQPEHAWEVPVLVYILIKCPPF